MLVNILFLVSLALQASAQTQTQTTLPTTHPVSVGREGLNFEPNSIYAKPGDIVEFRFWARNHSVVAGTFDRACVPATRGGFFSGFIPTAAGARNDTVFRVTINSTDPIVFYCSQNTGSHCKSGMVGTINAAEARGVDFYKALAANASTAVSPPRVFGGQLVLSPPPPNSSTTLTSTSTASASTSTLTATSTATATGTASRSGTASATATATAGAGAKGASFAGVVGVVVAALVFA
ncbi:hypothetical protein QBC39DRAFT_326322 [Podospora conica]|nr:hypothetical protein QBC39DRAFT_326322 [Schizothecium conicum]